MAPCTDLARGWYGIQVSPNRYRVSVFFNRSQYNCRGSSRAAPGSRAGEAARGGTSLCEGVVAAQSYQGAHLDIYVASDAAVSGRILIRQAQSDAATPWPVGAEVAIACVAQEAVAFPPER